MAEVAVQPVVGVLPDGAGVEDDHIRVLAAAGPLVSGFLQQAGQALGIVEVHLAPVGANLVCAHVLLLGLRGYACPGQVGKLPWRAWENFRSRPGEW